MSRATIPERWAVAIDVPLKKLKSSVDEPSGPDPTLVGHADRMFAPGAMISGFRMPPFLKLGPLEEKEATAGEGWAPNFMPLYMIFAPGVEVDSK